MRHFLLCATLVLVASLPAAAATSFIHTETSTMPLAGIAATTTLPAPATCDVVFRLVEPVTAGSLQFEVDYAAAPGGFKGSGPGIPNGGTLECSSLIAGALGAFNDDDEARSLTAAIIKTVGFTGPVALASCVFELDDDVAPVADDFVITVTDAKDPQVVPIVPTPTVDVSDIDCTHCGDGLPDLGEECDDGNLVDGDGCSSTCMVETGWDCAGFPPVCTENCGDGLVVGTEACDDGNYASGDGCSPSCGIEAGWNCPDEQSPCTELCGDGFVTGSEQCDDGNTESRQGEACSGACTWFGCCDSDGSGSVTASDALLILLSAVNPARGPCDRCLCDSITSPSPWPVSAVDSLACLRVAVGIATQTACPACEATTLPVETLEEIADVEAQEVWGQNVARGTGVPTYDDDGNVFSYIFPYAIGAPAAPAEADILEAVATASARHARRDEAFYADVVNQVGEMGSVQVAASMNDFPILAVLHSLHPYFLSQAAATEKAKTLLGTSDVALQGLLYLGPHEEYFQFDSESDSVSLQVHTLLSRDEVRAMTLESAPSTTKRTAFAPEVARRRDAAWHELAERAADPFAEPVEPRTITVIPNRTSIPVVDWTCWCVPTSMTMIAGFSDYYDAASSGTTTGYGRIIDYWHEQECNQNVPNFMDELTDVIDTSKCPAGCKWSSTSLEGILNTTNKYNFTLHEVAGTSSNDWAWQPLTDEIDTGRPVFWSVGPKGAHTMVAYGYRTSGSEKFVITYNTWGVTAAEQMAEYNYDQWSGAAIKYSGVGWLTPGGSTAPDHAVLRSPRGNEVLFGSSQIQWEVWGTTITKTTISFSADAGNTWTVLASNLPTTTGINNYSWNASTVTSEGRIKIQAYSTSGEYIAGDGSPDNFYVQSQADLVLVSSPTSGLCQKNPSGQLLVKIKNQGTTPAGASMTRIVFSPGGTVFAGAPAIAAGATANVAVTMPSACYDPDCSFTITIDVNDDVGEANEGNNSGNGTCVG
jgi:cysteine-rich repeat protein